MSLQVPPVASTNPLRKMASDVRAERSAHVALPPGDTSYSLARGRRFMQSPLDELLSAYRRYGPIFTLRLLHAPVVYMIGPEANHYVTVSHAQNFRWREGSMRDLIPLLGDGLLTTDGEVHRRARRLMLPAFHRESIAASLDTMVEETDLALEGWRPGREVDLYDWTRHLALRIAMRALFGFDRDAARHGGDPALQFDEALSYYSHGFVTQQFRGPGSPWGRMLARRRSLDALIYGEIARRRRNDHEAGRDVLSLLVESRGEDGDALSDEQVRDQVMTLLFAGHDTTTSTISFLFHQLARHPAALARLLEEQDRDLGGRAPSAVELVGGLPELEMAIDETLRLYPAAWVGPRRAVADFEFAGHTVPAGAHVAYCSWASHHLPEVFPDPEAFRPERFSPESRAKLPKGAYVPFGGGSRICLGMRFGQLEIKTIATMILQRFRLELVPAHVLRIRQAPTLSPSGGLPMTVRERSSGAPQTSSFSRPLR